MCVSEEGRTTSEWEGREQWLREEGRKRKEGEALKEMKRARRRR
jgi:hypothetical protein